MSVFILNTERLTIRKYELSDASFFLRLINAPKWKQFIGDRGLNTLEKTEDYIKERYISGYEENGFGAYICERRSDKVIVGTCGIYKRPNLDHPDIGFALLPEFEGQGYAYEAASAVMKFGRETYDINKYHGITLPINTASIKLLRKLGLKEQRSFTMEGDEEELLLFST